MDFVFNFCFLQKDKMFNPGNLKKNFYMLNPNNIIPSIFYLLESGGGNIGHFQIT